MNSNTHMLAIALASTLIGIGCGEMDDSTESTATAQDAVKCEGINECKGKSECASADGKNDCQGKNDCAGQGWVTVDSAEECEDAGGSVIG